MININYISERNNPNVPLKIYNTLYYNKFEVYRLEIEKALNPPNYILTYIWLRIGRWKINKREPFENEIKSYEYFELLND